MSTNTNTNSALGYDVFVADPLPMAGPGPLPNGEPRNFQPIAVTLIHGTRDGRRLHATFPEDIATHNTEQVFYYDADGLLRRHDYAPDVLGRPSAAHFAEQHITASGLVFPTHRYIVPTQEDGRALKEPVLISIDLTEISVD
ncbi:hypothetical protein OOK36_41540 [Streptomyces sp. NBC_00365]|uniref:hypothetical protein n=1 Tax=Streptomyces sp. NBC_00365 TaxID=2975726 RepID=UPI002251CAFD|nr:hypothetical protein [Streptomyces sp. NBC_00365]MCX5095222.1 hypothetical protein [Streptomyces sp. NBC_00365]